MLIPTPHLEGVDYTPAANWSWGVLKRFGAAVSRLAGGHVVVTTSYWHLPGKATAIAALINRAFEEGPVPLMAAAGFGLISWERGVEDPPLIRPNSWMERHVDDIHYAFFGELHEFWPPPVVEEGGAAEWSACWLFSLDKKAGALQQEQEVDKVLAGWPGPLPLVFRACKSLHQCSWPLVLHIVHFS